MQNDTKRIGRYPIRFFIFILYFKFAARVILTIRLITKAVSGRVLCPSLFTVICAVCKFCCILLSFAAIMKLPFYKYQGTGNDFVIIDNRQLGLKLEDAAHIRQLCDRRFGIGADGLIYLQERDGYDFEMVYYNSDGRESTMCGNGGRCIVKFAHDMGLGKDEFSFLAIDGPHRGRILPGGIVAIQMKDVDHTSHRGDHYVLDTGSPHYVQFVKDIKAYPVVESGKSIRYNDTYRAEGINVNFVEELARGQIFVRTYERGVEDETYSCGTGVVASAISYFYEKDAGTSDISVKTLGGNLNVRFDLHGPHFINVWLTGPAELVFRGETTI